TDFEGNFDLQPDGLRDLQSLLAELESSKVEWFKLREPDLVKQLHYPLTASSKAWGDTLITLAKVVIEGLDRSFFERQVRDRGGKGDPKWASIRYAQEALTVGGTDPQAVADIVAPLVELQKLRTKLSAHSGGAEAKTLRAALLRKHKSPRGHVE